jgi:hypothetical protein
MATSSASPDNPKASINGATPVAKEEPKVVYKEALPVTNEELLEKLRVSKVECPRASGGTDTSGLSEGSVREASCLGERVDRQAE